MMETQKKETENKIKKSAKRFLGAIGAGLISVSINSVVTNINLWESTKKIAVFLFQVDIGLLILILILFKIVYSLHQKNKSLSNFQNELSDTNIETILSNNKRLIKINDELRESANNLIGKYKNIKNEIKEEMKVNNHKEIDKKIELNPQQIFILQKLGEQSNLLLEQETLFDYYGDPPQRDRLNFNIAINHLKKLNMIMLNESYDGDDFITLTDFGLECLGAIEAKKAK